MMIRVNGEYLDFNSDIEIEEQIKLFKDIETANGDYSYSFELSKTNKNLKALGLPFPDTIKRIYNNVPCELVDETGLITRNGSLQVTGITDVITASFFGGNNDWFSLLGNPMTSLPLYKYDTDITVSAIQNSWSKEEGLVFPIIDTGTLVTRKFSNFKVEDFNASFYVKTLFNEIFWPLGIKLKGDLIENDVFSKMVVSANTKSQDLVDARSTFAQKTSDQGFGTIYTNCLFQNTTIFPYFDGIQNNFTTGLGSIYTADVKMLVEVTLDIRYTYDSGSFPQIAAFVDATMVEESDLTGTALIDNVFSVTYTIPLNQLNSLTIRAQRVGGVSFVIYEGSTLRIKPIFIYRAFGSSSVPNWTQGEFVSNILRIFNVLPSYNSVSRTLTLDLFNNIKNKESIDISQDVTISEVDYSGFVSSYAKVNTFKYQEGSDDDLREYNISNFVTYGSGQLMIDNDFIKNTADIIESDFTPPITYLNNTFGFSLEKIEFIELEEITETDITSVSNSSGVPRFNISNADDTFEVGSIVRIDTLLNGYNGDFVVNAVTSSYITVNGLNFSSSTTGTATLLRHKFTTNDEVHIFINVANVNTLFFSPKSSMLIDNTSFSTASIAYFNLLSVGREISAKYKQSLSFGSVNNPLSYQKSLLDTYWPIFSQILNDPVMIKGNAYFTRVKYEQLKTFLRPLRLSTVDTNNLYYLNRIRGYKNSSKPCYVELIKL